MVGHHPVELAVEQRAPEELDVLAPGDPDMLAWIAAALPHTDHLLPNDEQVLGFTGAATLAEGALALVAAGAGCVAVTQGARGALVATADGVTEVPAYAIEVVDTTGCGDAFSAGYLRGLSLDRTPAEAAALGCATAAQVAQGLGTDAGSYDLAAVEGRMASLVAACERHRGEPGTKQLARIENYLPYAAGLDGLFRGPRTLDLLAACCGEPVLLFKDKINFKLPGGAGFGDHQDAPAYVDFGVEHHLTFATPADPFTIENGCLEMALDA